MHLTKNIEEQIPKDSADEFKDSIFKHQKK